MEELKSLLQQNLRLTKELDERVRKIQRYILWQRIFGIVKVVLIVVPLVLAILYALPFVSDAFETYRGVTGALDNLSGGGSVKGISPGLIEQFLK